MKSAKTRRAFSEERKLHVLVVDDSALVRQVMTQVLQADPRIQVGTASDPIIAFDKIAKAKPDVIITDLEMPRMDGFSFLKRIMHENPIPVLVCSGITGSGTALALRMLEEGAI